ncbi:MAG: energy transducer TonB [Cyanobacteria bacterium SZAS-4]|nr:energy transducer TonB [Cyanobacteria bacterium SZAS-4]
MTKLLIFLGASFALILYSVSPIKANEQQENTKPVISLEELQKLISSEISQAKNRGVGTKPYEDAFAAINTDFEHGEAPDKIRQRYESILKNLKIQNKESNLFRSGRPRLVHTSGEHQSVHVTEGGKDTDEPQSRHSSNEQKWGEFAPLMRSLQRKIKSNWHPTTQAKNHRLAVLFELLKDGRIRNLKVTKSSGYSEADSAALDAVRKSVPFQRPPANLDSNQEGTWIEFNFND